MTDYRVKPKTKLHLKEIDPNTIGDYQGGKKEGLIELLKLNKKLEGLQELLYAEHKHKVLIILQAMDTGGKDGVIRSVFEGVNPQGVRVVSFKVPSLEELDHDYLWRVHKNTPGKGEIVIFNRSHYEDVLVVRVHKIAPQKVWGKRYQHINNFEKELADEGTTILKFYLHIDEEEQRQRLLDRIEDPQKNWKFNPSDLEERKLWSDYRKAFEEAIEKTSTSWAPWFVIPANRNWYRNLIISKILVEKLEDLKMKYPEPAEDIQKYAAVLKEGNEG